jgi:hypothetical protein
MHSTRRGAGMRVLCIDRLPRTGGTGGAPAGTGVASDLQATPDPHPFDAGRLTTSEPSRPAAGSSESRHGPAQRGQH